MKLYNFESCDCITAPLTTTFQKFQGFALNNAINNTEEAYELLNSGLTEVFNSLEVSSKPTADEAVKHVFKCLPSFAVMFKRPKILEVGYNMYELSLTAKNNNNYKIIMILNYDRVIFNIELIK